MGFRSPITTATAVDTRASASSAGARMYSRPISGQPGAVQGVVELDDGLGDTPATFTSTPGTQRSVNGGSTQLGGGSYSGTGAPDVTLDVLTAGDPALQGVPLPSGAQYGRRARITGADVFTIDTGTQILGDGVPIVCASKAARDNLNKYDGLLVLRTDLAGGLLQRWDGTAWRFTLAGTFSGTTDTNAMLVFAHGGDGQTPVSWIPVPTGQATDAIACVFKPLAWAQDGTNLTMRAVRTDTSAYFPGQSVKGFWIAQF